MRPPGEISLALRSAAAERPGPVRALAASAQVGYAAARYTASRMVDRGELVVLNAGERPMVLGVAPPVPPVGETLAQALQDLRRSFWDRPEPVSDSA